MIIKVYHGSTLCLPEPALLPLTRRLDFGAGFYTTSDMVQARRWACVKKRRKMDSQAVVSIYDVPAVFDSDKLSIKHFDTPDTEWLDFVMAHRMGKEQPNMSYDVICGPVANDTLYETLTLYERGILNHSETIARLKTHKLADQIVFATLKDALAKVYHSRLYKSLECEETKLWHHSPMLLLDCMMSELETGVLEFPDE